MQRNSFWQTLGTTFLKGLAAILPLGITVALVLWLLDLLEKIFGTVVEALIGPTLYFPGLGLLVGLVFVFCIGLIINALLVQKVYRWADSQLKRIPLVKTLYSAVCDLMNFFSKQNKESSQVVLLHLGQMQLVGLVTRDDYSDLPEGMGGPDMVSVYVPMSYQLGGFTVTLPKSQLTYIDMSVEKAMRFAVTAGMQMPTASSTKGV